MLQPAVSFWFQHAPQPGRAPPSGGVSFRRHGGRSWRICRQGSCISVADLASRPTAAQLPARAVLTQRLHPPTSASVLGNPACLPGKMALQRRLWEAPAPTRKSPTASRDVQRFLGLQGQRPVLRRVSDEARPGQVTLGLQVASLKQRLASWPMISFHWTSALI